MIGTEVVRVLLDRMTSDASAVLFGGIAKDQPYPEATMVTAFDGGVATLVNTRGPDRATPGHVIHPGAAGDTPRWANADHPAKSRTPIGRLVTSDEVTWARMARTASAWLQLALNRLSPADSALTPWHWRTR